MSTNVSSVALLIISSLIISLSDNTIAFEVKRDDRYNDVLYNEIDSNGVDVNDIASEEYQSQTSHLESVAKHMTQRLRSVVTDELGVTHMQQIYDTLNTVKHNINFERIIEDITQKMSKKFEEMSVVLETTSQRVDDLFRIHHKTGEISTLRTCCDQRLSAVMQFDQHFNTQITKATSCDITPTVLTDGSFAPGINLTEHFRTNLDKYPNIKWQYFMSVWGVHTEYPAYMPFPNNCHLNQDITEFQTSRTPFDILNDESLQRHRDLYLATVLPQSKHVVLVIDRGSALTAHQLGIAKAISKYILNSLSYNDKIGLISLSSDAIYPNSDSCLTRRMANANYETKYHFQRFIDGLQRTTEPTNHVLGLSRAFEMITNTFNDINDIKPKPSEALIVYISRGLLSSLTDAKLVMELIAEEVNKSSHSIAINSYALIDDSKPVMYETTFLKEIAEMNFPKFNVKSPDSSKIKPGIMVPVNNTEQLSVTLSGIYSVLTRPTHSSIYISLPSWDIISKDIHISVSKSVIHRGQLIGVVGLDLSLSDLAEDIINFDISQDSYAFLIEKTQGIAIHHPSFSRPSQQTHEHLMHTDIEHIEQQTGFKEVKSMILSTPNGEHRVPIDRKSNLTYIWRRVHSSPYIVIVATLSDNQKQQTVTSPLAKDAHFSYHRLDLNANPPRLCRHLKQLATIETATLFLSSKAFLSPYHNDRQEETLIMVQRYMAFLNDNTKLIANPGLKSTVRGDVHAVTRVISYWKSKLESSELSKFIVRKYITTANGVFLVYPGALIDKSFDPTRREWYIKAVKNPGKIVFTAPYLDVGGAGYLVTLSHTLLEPKPTALHSNSDQIVAVMAMDFTLGYFHRFLQTYIGSICNEDQIACLLMDDRGYLIAHPSLVEPVRQAPIEQQHITHKEPLVANELLNHKHFIEKNVCNSFIDRTIQRFYNFNTSLTGVMKNHKHGDHCAKYQITAVSGTNVFVGVVNHTCDAVTAFCPCSMTDRLCLNCHRMEQTDCECPCECPLEMSVCTGELFDEEDRNPICPPLTEQLRPVPVMRQMLEIQSCFEMSCFNKKTENDCLGLLGCEWCQLDRNGETPLKNPYCNYQSRCFGGILGAKTPYADEIIDIAYAHDDYVPIGSAPVGPVAGGIMICFIMLALSVYCYRYHSARNGPHYITSIADNGLNHSHFDNEYDETEPHEEITPAIAPTNAVVLASFENAAQISPYRINPSYRRPGGGSDHGYSTMTPHEDSELGGPTYIEPLLVGRDKIRLMNTSSQSDATNSSRASSPSLVGLTVLKKSKPLPQTILEVPNNVQAQVQVHMIDTH